MGNRTQLPNDDPRASFPQLWKDIWAEAERRFTDPTQQSAFNDACHWLLQRQASEQSFTQAPSLEQLTEVVQATFKAQGKPTDVDVALSVAAKVMDLYTTVPVKREGGALATAVIEQLGFDPTNHHNAAKCPYCTPKPTVQASGEKSPEERAALLLNAAEDPYLIENYPALATQLDDVAHEVKNLV